MTIQKPLFSFFFASCLLAAPPVITSIQNPASNILPGLPNFGIAEGGIFVLYGSGLGPTTLLSATLPLPTILPASTGTQIKITQNGVSYLAPVFYVWNSQVAAVMPSNVPVGASTVQVTYNGVAGNSFSTTVVASDFGISTVDESGGGRAIVTDGSYKLITSTNSAVPGNTYTIWGTGLGPDNSDNNIPTSGAFPNVHVFVGGTAATVTYYGLSGGVALNQINFTIPAGLSGCNISLIVQSDTTPAIVSNATTIPITPGGGVCSDANNVSQTAINAALANGSLSLGLFDLDADQQTASAIFLRFTSAQYPSAGLFDSLSPGSCTTFVETGSGGAHSGNPNGDAALSAAQGLNAGSALTVTTPAGVSLPMALAQTGIYQSSIASVASGIYKFVGVGGSDVGSFSAAVNGPPAFTWTNPNIRTVARSQGLAITWAGGDANSTVNISGYANGNPVLVNGIGTPANTYVQFECEVPATTGTFTVPTNVLLALPGTTSSTANGSVFVYLQANPQALTIPGIDYSFGAWNTATVSANVAYQ